MRGGRLIGGNPANRVRAVIMGCHSRIMLSDETGVQGSVTDLARERWGVTLGGEFPARFTEPGWSHEETVDRRCPACAGELHALRRPYESQGRTYQYTALVCPACPTAFTLADLGVKRYDQLTDAVPRQAGQTQVGQTTGTGSSRPAPAVTATVRVPAQPRAGVRAGRGPVWPDDLVVPDGTEQRALLWCKVADPAWRPADAALAAAEDVRVILPVGPEYEPLRTWLKERDVPYRVSRYWEEAGQVGTVSDTGGRTELVVAGPAGAAPAAGPWATAARDAFAVQWDALEELPDGDGDTYVPVGELVPPSGRRCCRTRRSTRYRPPPSRWCSGAAGIWSWWRRRARGRPPSGWSRPLRRTPADARRPGWCRSARSPTNSTASSSCGAAAGCGWCA